MKKSDFFNRLHEEGKIQIVPPGEDIMSSYMKKSDSHLISAKLLLENDRLEESVSLQLWNKWVAYGTKSILRDFIGLKYIEKGYNIKVKCG